MLGYEVGETVGKIECGLCGMPALVKLAKNKHLYATCSWAKDGCGNQQFSRTDDADEFMMRKVNAFEKKNITAQAVPVEKEPAKKEVEKPKPKPKPKKGGKLPMREDPQDEGEAKYLFGVKIG